MDNLVELLKSIKFPTLTASGLALYFGYALVDGSGESINTPSEGMGVVLLALGALLLLVTFLDFRHKDSTENVIASQTKVIKNLEGLFKSVSDTRKQEEKLNQKSMTSGTRVPELGGDGKKGFRIDESDATPTS